MINRTAEPAASRTAGGNRRPNAGIGNGVVSLGAAETALLHAVDSLVVAAATALGAPEVIGPSLLPADQLDSLDYFINFPHLGLVAAEIAPDSASALAGGQDLSEVGGDTLVWSGYLLPSATCYGLFISIAGHDLHDPLQLTASGQCFRNEDHYEGLRRLRGFHMREILYIGHRDGADIHLRTWRSQIERLSSELGLVLECQPAVDPFYDRQGPRSRLATVDPVKHEYVAPDGTAVASVNRHRNFFGERLQIRFGGEPAYSSCVAFGLERWVHSLVLAHGDPSAAADRVRGLKASS